MLRNRAVVVVLLALGSVGLAGPARASIPPPTLDVSCAGVLATVTLKHGSTATVKAMSPTESDTLTLTNAGTLAARLDMHRRATFVVAWVTVDGLQVARREVRC